MSFIARLQRARAILEQQGRLSTRALGRELEIGGDELAELVEELVDVQQVARREGAVLVWAGTPAAPPADVALARPAAAATPPPAAPQPDARKVVTILFADLAGSTALHERLDPESARRFMESYYRAMRAAIDAHGGTLVKFLGDGVMAAFGVPHVAEDDAIRAVRAGVAMQEAFRALAREHAAIGLRVAINTGEVVVSADNTDVVGDPVNVAARLQQEAADGDVVLGASTRRLVAALVTLAPLGSFTLKGRTEPVQAWRLVSLDRPTGATLAPFVGRDDELARLTAVYEAARATPAGRLAVLLGSPGLGKSRLIEEVAGRLGDTASVVTAHCDAAGGATFAPMAAALREFFRLEAGASPQAVQAAIEAAIPAADAERGRVATGIAAVLAGSPASPEETFFVIRRLLAGLAAVRPVVLVIDDLHWAEPLLLDLVEHLVEWGHGVPLLVLVGARPELRDLRASLVTPGALVADVVTLSGLDAGAAMRLAANVIGAADLPAAVAARVLATSEGNPLFVGELVRMLVDEGAIERHGERWIVGANLAALEMPPTIHALLAARIDRLAPEDRTVLERAAVVGRHFSRSALAALLGRNGSALNARLEALQRTELIERDTGWFLGEPMLRFHHVLIRDAAYRRLLKGTRADLHEQLADWMEAQVADAPEHDETIGWHLEQAHQHRRELGPLDARGRMLGARAAQRLAAAGRRALERDDVPVAASLLGRAIDRLDRDDPARADLALDWCEALLAAGDVAAAVKAIDELGRFVGDRGLRGYGVTGSGGIADPPPTPNPLTPNPLRLRAWHTCFTGQLTVLTAPQALHATADAVAAAAEALAALDDAAGEAKGHFVHALALARLGRVGGCEAALDKALAAARRADDRRRANTVLAIAPLAALWGPSPVTRASGRCLDVVRVLRITQGAPAVEAVALSCQAVLEALRGRTEAARRMIAAARKMVEDLGVTQRLLETDVFVGLIDLLEGDAVAAERNLRRAYDGLRDLGLGIDAARAAALLARALLAQDRGAETEALSHDSEALAGDDLKAAIAWRGVRAEALARRGEPTAAVVLANEAVEIAAATDALLDHADARLALAAALRAAGRGPDAEAEERRAIDLWEAKGATLLVERTRRADAPIAATTAAPPPVAAPGPRRRIVSNRASEALVAFNAAMAAPDLAAFREQLSASYEEIDHPTGVSYGRDANVAALERLMRSRHASCQLEPLATLGDALVLSRRRVSASATGGGRFDVGEYEQEAYTIAELDGQGRWCRHEVFGAHHLGDALTALYERHVALLPEGPERERAASTAASFAVTQDADADPERVAGALAPDVESVDHRHLSSWSLRGADAYLAHLRALREVADGVEFRQLDLLASSPNAQLARVLHTGIDRAGGGPYERPFLRLFAAGADGRIARAEWFDDDREAEALARFDEIVAGAAPHPAVIRRVTPNAATATAERFGAAVAARDLDALAAVLCEEVETLHHQTGAGYGRRGFLATWRSMFQAETMLRRQETIASLGDTLALAHHTIRLEGFTEDHIADVGAVEIDEVVLFEVDERGRTRRFDIFPVEKLGDALVRFYKRYAELLPDGAERTRVAGIARSLAAFSGPIDLDRLREAYAPSHENIDHRIFGTWSTSDAEEIVRHFRLQRDLAPDFAGRYDEIFAASVHAAVARMTFLGTARDSGGRFENHICVAFTFGVDGRMTHTDTFEAEQEAAALARFDELTGTIPAEAGLFENAASRAWRSVNDAWNARDLARFAAPHAPALRYRDHRRLLQLDLDRAGFLDFTRPLLTMRTGLASLDLVATRGERLALMHSTMAMEGDAVGPSTIESLFLIETDEHGAIVAYDRWDLDDRAAALAALDERWAASEDAWHERSGQDALLALQRGDWDGYAAPYTPDVIINDHRLAGIGVAHGSALLVRAGQAMAALAPDARLISWHVRACRRGRIAQWAWSGTRDGGAFESPFILVAEYGPDGRTVRLDSYDPHNVDRALARYAELQKRSGELAGRGTDAAADWENAAARADRVLFERFNARDWPGIEALAAPDLVFDERRRMLHNTCGRAVWLEQFHVLYDVPASRFTTELLGTFGERLSLSLHRFAGEVAGGGGPVEMDDHLVLHEVDGEGRLVAIVLFDPDDEEAAWNELRARFLAGEGAPPYAGGLLVFERAVNARDWEAAAATVAPTLVEHDHRRITGIGTPRDREAWLPHNMRSWFEVAPDLRFCFRHARWCERGSLWQLSLEGTRDGGRFEIAFVGVTEMDEQGLAQRIDIHDLDRLDDARARFAELAGGADAPAPRRYVP